MGTKIDGYKVITGNGTKELEKKVMEAIKDGWKLVGGVSNSKVNFAQAMIKESFFDHHAPMGVRSILGKREQ